MTNLDSKQKNKGEEKAFIERPLKAGILSSFEAQIVLKEASESFQTLEELCVEMGFVSSEIAGVFREELRGIPEVDLSKILPDPELVSFVSPEICTSLEMIPLYQRDSEVGVVLGNVKDPTQRDKAPLFPGQKIKFFSAPRNQIQEALQRNFEGGFHFERALQAIDQNASLSSEENGMHPTVHFVNGLLRDAVREGASDIHCEPEKFFVCIRYRCDRLLKVIFAFHRSYWPAILARFKILSEMDIAETRHPQDGRFTQQILGREVDFRVACHPTIHGENLVVRLLDRERVCLRLSELGYISSLRESLTKRLRHPEGLMIVTGPTGSRKTTSLYAFTQGILLDELNIMILEEPVEYQIPFLQQKEIKERAGFHFA